MKKYLVVTGGAGFVGSNLIEFLVNKTKFDIISIDNYSSGSKKNHIKSNRVKYLNTEIKYIDMKLKRYVSKINTIFHFGEFSRIYKSFKYYNECLETNSRGTQSVFKFCLNNNLKLVYSATSASIGNKGDDKNLSPYAFSKAKNLELLENLKKWFNFKYEIIYFYNVYGKRHIKNGEMATVIGIFEDQYENNLPLTVVKPGNQSRRFTHISDTVKVCYEAWKKNKCRHYSISHKKSYSINEVAKMFNSKVKYLPRREGERYASKLTNMSLNNKVIKKYGKIDLKDYVTSFIKDKNYEN